MKLLVVIILILIELSVAQNSLNDSSEEIFTHATTEQLITTETLTEHTQIAKNDWQEEYKLVPASKVKSQIAKIKGSSNSAKAAVYVKIIFPNL